MTASAVPRPTLAESVEWAKEHAEHRLRFLDCYSGSQRDDTERMALCLQVLAEAASDSARLDHIDSIRSEDTSGPTFVLIELRYPNQPIRESIDNCIAAQAASHPQEREISETK